MDNDPELSGKYLGTITKDFVKVSDNLKEASYQIRTRGFSDHPIFPISKSDIPIGQLLIKKGELDSEWFYNASYLDEFVQRKLVEEDNIPTFEAAYKDPDEFCCLFVLDEKFTNFIFIPYPEDWLNHFNRESVDHKISHRSKHLIVDVIIPVLNEQNAVGRVIDEIPESWIRRVIVVDNGSTDDTPAVARDRGAVVLHEPRKGYGSACLRGMDHIADQSDTLPDIVVFLDGDHSDFPEQLPDLVRKISKEDFDLVIGSRALGQKEKGAMTVQQVFGNWLATFLIRIFYGVEYTDLGPFRAIKYDRLLAINMQDRNYGWTVEMQLKAAKLKMKTTEVPVNYRRRIGVSKISGTIKGTILAGHKIITTIFKYL